MLQNQLQVMIRPWIRPCFRFSFFPASIAPVPPAQPAAGWAAGGPACPLCAAPMRHLLHHSMAQGFALPVEDGWFDFYLCPACLLEAELSSSPQPWLLRFSAEPLPHDLTTGFSLRSVPSLPDWDGLDRFIPRASVLAAEQNSEEPWAAYQSAAEAQGALLEPASQVGGYPLWLQGDETPACPLCGQAMRLLFQLDSERKLGWLWGDAGCLYLFVCSSHPSHMQLVLQSL